MAAHSVKSDNFVDIASTKCKSLIDLLDSIREKAGSQDEISIKDIVTLTGNRWYGPLLIVTGLVMMTPIIGDIPGVPIIMGAIVILISIQLLWKRNQLWLPEWILKRRIDSEKANTAIDWMRPPCRFVDKFTRARFTPIVRHAGLVMIALMSILVASTTPVLELIPFSATLAGAAIAAFGIGVLSEDGAIALGATAFSLLTIVVVTYFFL